MVRSKSALVLLGLGLSACVIVKIMLLTPKTDIYFSRYVPQPWKPRRAAALSEVRLQSSSLEKLTNANDALDSLKPAYANATTDVQPLVVRSSVMHDGVAPQGSWMLGRGWCAGAPMASYARRWEEIRPQCSERDCSTLLTLNASKRAKCGFARAQRSVPSTEANNMPMHLNPGLHYTPYILVSHVCRLVYFRVHKCGSTSVRDFLNRARPGFRKGLCPDLGVYRSRRNYNFERGAPPGWDLDATLAGEPVRFESSERAPEPYLRFTLVRDPISRFLSTFNFIHPEGGHGAPHVVNRPMEGWTNSGLPQRPLSERRAHLRHVLRELPEALGCRKNARVRSVRNDHFQRAVNFMQDEFGRGFATDFMGRLEDGMLPTLLRLRRWLQGVGVISEADGGAAAGWESGGWDAETSRRHRTKKMMAGRPITWPWEVTRADLEPADVRVLCTAYAADYACYGYEMPPDCRLR